MLIDYQKVLEATLAEVVSYNEAPTKASSKRIRALSLHLGKLGAPLRQHMIKLDKGK